MCMMPFFMGARIAGMRKGYMAGMEELKVKDFNLKQTLECGQCFNFEQLYDEGDDRQESCVYEYDVIAFGKWLRIRQEGSRLVFLNASSDDIEKIWIPYFDLNRDYGVVKNAVICADPDLESVINQYYGIRILNQDFTETLISFIISQNKNIPHIKALVRNMSEHYGNPIGQDESSRRVYYSFPDLAQLDTISVQDFRDLKTGFRAPYLRDAVDKMVSGQIREEELRSVSFAQAKEKLTSIKGVGDKVANCVLLFGLGFRNAFPVDVWIKRIMEVMYFHKDTDKKIIEEFAREKFGEYGGYAQQYLFIYAKNK